MLQKLGVWPPWLVCDFLYFTISRSPAAFVLSSLIHLLYGERQHEVKIIVDAITIESSQTLVFFLLEKSKKGFLCFLNCVHFIYVEKYYIFLIRIDLWNWRWNPTESGYVSYWAVLSSRTVYVLLFFVCVCLFVSVFLFIQMRWSFLFQFSAWSVLETRNDRF